VLNLKTVEHLGKISYSMYLWQQIITNVGIRTAMRIRHLMDLPIAWAVILLVVLSYELPEKPP
jgi:peptidoglycan/LPS O-acetylase OafA/YrhL